MTSSCAAWALVASLACGAAPAPAPVRAESVLITLIDQAEVPAHESGALAELAVREGQIVTEGQLVARVEDTMATLAMRRAKVELDIARKEETNDVQLRYARGAATTAKAELARATNTLEKYRKSVSGSEVDQLRLAVDKAEREAEQAEHDLAVARLTTQLKHSEYDLAVQNVDRRRIVAPIQGMVVEVKRRRGEWVHSGDTVVRILRLDRLRAEGFVQAAAVSGPFQPRPVTVRVDLPGQPRAEFPGSLVFISPEVNPVNGQVRVWAELDNRDSLLRPGMPVEMTLEASQGGSAKAAE